MDMSTLVWTNVLWALTALAVTVSRRRAASLRRSPRRSAPPEPLEAAGQDAEAAPEVCKGQKKKAKQKRQRQQQQQQPGGAAAPAEATLQLRPCLRTASGGSRASTPLTPPLPGTGTPVSGGSVHFHLAPRPPGADCRVADQRKELNQWKRRYEVCKEELHRAEAELRQLGDGEDREQLRLEERHIALTKRQEEQECELQALRARLAHLAKRREDKLQLLQRIQHEEKQMRGDTKHAGQALERALADCSRSCEAEEQAQRKREAVLDELRAVTQRRLDLGSELRAAEADVRSARRRQGELKQRLGRLRKGAREGAQKQQQQTERGGAPARRSRGAGQLPRDAQRGAQRSPPGEQPVDDGTARRE
eukprot:TRINITY_DN14906_c0_g1_i1.p1 TRINITY_DN14906_c0_g1~~TRINITY_DN14906_c0_g1_i1.p1  ORF type:complete len:364 (+),score=141.72 TRINITY_DN14906_c0_g1_i1:100-1191(+)